MSQLQIIKYEYIAKSTYKSLLLVIFYSFLNLPSFAQKLKSDTTLQFNFSDLSRNKGSVIVFFDTDCPICQKYTRLLKEINQQYSAQGIKVYVVYPHNHVDIAAIRGFKTEYQFDLPIYFDKKQKLLHQLKGSVTPEVFLLNNQGRTIYHGAIDNWFYGLGKSRTKATENYLLNAIDALIKGENIKITYHEPIGCAL
ncbi:redoxin domain-containing protein [Emticicia agri]|uniref:Redoxin domain-containing protein n=1 Tax=Emticicia agri TaxID=2492393 RepID=A0A4Q5M1V9_9BACT|nr:redoxin domain-containing protein [Emticicia agri]RYU96306.1 redoxin domain-containing protein [Emticicia agri]